MLTGKELEQAIKALEIELYYGPNKFLETMLFEYREELARIKRGGINSKNNDLHDAINILFKALGILVLIVNLGCKDPSDSLVDSTPTPKVPVASSPTATPTPVPTPTPSPTPSPTPTPVPTPDPLIGVWQNSDDASDVFVFEASSGSQSSCEWTWSGWSWTDVGEVTLHPLHQNISGIHCTQSPHFYVDTRACSVHFNNSNMIAMTCLYNGQHVYVRQ